MKSKEIKMISSVILIGIVIAVFIISADKPSTRDNHHDKHQEDNDPKGPHRGRLLTKNDFQLEISIYEKGVPPQFRVYAYENSKIISPEGVKVTIKLHRFGGRVDLINFKKEGKYLLGDKVVEEPHSFDVEVIAERMGQHYNWIYSTREGRVKISLESLKSSGIIVKTAGPAQLKTILDLPGQIILNPDRISHIVPRVKGIAKEVYGKLGDTVNQGDILAVLSSPKLAEAKSEYLAWFKRLKFARKTFEREKYLWRKEISSEQEYLNAKQTFAEAKINLQKTKQTLLALGSPQRDIYIYSLGQDLTRHEIQAPLNGTIIKKHITTGEAVKEDTLIFVIADLSTVWVEAAIYTYDLNRVKLGQKVTVKSKSLSMQVNGRLNYLSPLVDEHTRTVKARIVIPNHKGKWRPGLYVSVELIQEETTVPVAVPIEAIQTFRDWDVVFIQYGDEFEARPLKLGRRDKEWVEVIEGLSAGEKYVAQNSFVLKADVLKSGATHDH